MLLGSVRPILFPPSPVTRPVPSLELDNLNPQPVPPTPQ
jgi:hypothetical protein